MRRATHWQWDWQRIILPLKCGAAVYFQLANIRIIRNNSNILTLGTQLFRPCDTRYGKIRPSPPENGEWGRTSRHAPTRDYWTGNKGFFLLIRFRRATDSNSRLAVLSYCNCRYIGIKSPISAPASWQPFTCIYNQPIARLLAIAEPLANITIKITIHKKIAHFYYNLSGCKKIRKHPYYHLISSSRDYGTCKPHTSPWTHSPNCRDMPLACESGVC